VTTTVLVIGGSGQLGAPVVRQLLEDGFRVRLLVRASSPAPAEGPEFHMLAAEDFAAMVSRALSTDRTMDQILTVYGPEAYTIPAALRIYCHKPR
jgi:uncharacterized protein YbjT (DUF2867 family)